MQDSQEFIQSLFSDQWYSSYLVIGILCLVAYFITSRILLRTVSHLFKKTSTKFDDILIEQRVFNKLPYLVPLIILYNSKDIIFWNALLDRAILSAIAIVFLYSLNAFINAFNEMFKLTDLSKKFSIKSYTQIGKLLINIFGIIVVMAILTGNSPVYLLSGLGALTAVLVLVFKDTILSLVSSVQISSNDLFKVGDWVEAPQFGADGDVIDIALHSVKIQNWDKTISVIPTNKLIDSSFKNWRGMSESGGRRIKRSINIDMNTIKFCTKEMIDRYSKFNVISDYLKAKLEEIQQFNSDSKVEEEGLINGRSLTNIGTFRAYVEGYLRNHNQIHNEMTFLVRQLPPNASGLPIGIYVFSNDTDWANYEKIQSDIFDHLLSVVSEFELKVFQNPSGSDFKSSFSEENKY
ncbi:MAG: mechanosensitive ion channel domain-containing protein [Candidatus Neomarinimicrobiota bacterium]|nr:mechanosensitive ion channel domain-containing protein [Candidatus Neomarinimicrobiota bacterium]